MVVSLFFMQLNLTAEDKVRTLFRNDNKLVTEALAVSQTKKKGGTGGVIGYPIRAAVTAMRARSCFDGWRYLSWLLRVVTHVAGFSPF